MNDAPYMDPSYQIMIDLTTEAHKLHAQQRDKEALQKIDACLQFEPKLASPLFLKSLIALSHGDYEAGWPMFELRHMRADTHPYVLRHRVKPMWDGKATDKKVLIWGAEGLGDTVQMLRFMPEVMKLCPNLLVEVQFPVQRLTKLNFPTLNVITATDENPDFDLQCAMLSLPLVLGKNLKNISGEPYLKTSDVLIRDWAFRKPEAVHLGLAWHGNKANARDAVRSLPVAAINPLAKAFDFIPLQREHSHFDDVADMAALMENLDTVVTVDTLMAHLAGALGKKTHLMLGVDCDWRWLQNRADCPWYRSIEIHRQQEHNDWTPVVDEVLGKLKKDCFPSAAIRNSELAA